MKKTIVKNICTELYHGKFLFPECRNPDNVINATPSLSNDPWLFGDSFSYVCSDNLQISGSSLNKCFLFQTSTDWLLSAARDSLPTCGIFHFEHFNLSWIQPVFIFLFFLLFNKANNNINKIEHFLEEILQKVFVYWLINFKILFE